MDRKQIFEVLDSRKIGDILSKTKQEFSNVMKHELNQRLNITIMKRSNMKKKLKSEDEIDNLLKMIQEEELDTVTTDKVNSYLKCKVD